MRISTLLISLVSLLPFATAGNNTFSHRVPRTNIGASVGASINVDKSNWNRLKCSNVAGQWAGHSFDFGCLCADDVDDFCRNNNINANIKALLSAYIGSYGVSSLYPPNAQPTCYNNDYTCGSLKKNNDGTCGSTTCSPNTCSSNGGCCPRGQSYENGKCCAKTGCDRQKTCTPILTCSTYTSNDICCSDATGKGWIGQKTRCCPAGKIEVNGQCACPAGTKASGSSCVSVCGTNESWCTSRCCPNDATEQNGQCVCKSDQQSLKDGKCSNICPGTQTFYPAAKACCPAGSTYKNGRCDCGSQATLTGSGAAMTCQPKCPGTQAKIGDQCCPAGVKQLVGGKCDCGSQATLTGSGASLTCKPKCDVGSTYYTSKCCPTGATEVNGQCKCSSSSQQLTTVNGKPQCSDKCQGEDKWCNSRCCPKWLEEDSQGKCVCSDEAFSPDYSRKKCVPKCAQDEKYDYNKHQCAPICDTSAGYFYKQGYRGNYFCCRRSETACSTTCCPAGTVEIGTSGKCCKEGSTLGPDGQCIAPTVITGPKPRRALAGRILADQLALAPSPNSYGIEENRNGTLCPGTMAACPIEGAAVGTFECLDTTSDLQSCGGCLGLGHGRDCTAIAGAKWMGCNAGLCEVYSCKRGWRRSGDGSGCVRV